MRHRRRHYLNQAADPYNDPFPESPSLDPWADPYPEQPERTAITDGELVKYEPAERLPIAQPLTPAPSAGVNLGSFLGYLKPAFFGYLLLNDELPTLARAGAAYFLWDWFRGEGAPVAAEIESQLPELPAISRWR